MNFWGFLLTLVLTGSPKRPWSKYVSDPAPRGLDKRSHNRGPKKASINKVTEWEPRRASIKKSLTGRGGLNDLLHAQIKAALMLIITGSIFCYLQPISIHTSDEGWIEYLLWQLLFYVDFSFQTSSTKCPINKDQIRGTKPEVVPEELKDLGNLLCPLYLHLWNCVHVNKHCWSILSLLPSTNSLNWFSIQ